MSRSIKKGPFVADHLLKKIEKMDSGEKRSVILHGLVLPQYFPL
jgi:ribosomal protein S19